VADNTQMGSSTDTIRDVQKGGSAGPKTPVSIIDVGGGGAEVLLAAGQAAMAACLPVAIASNQSAVPVAGTFWQATQPVSGTVTANAGAGTFAVSAASLPLPTGAAGEHVTAASPHAARLTDGTSFYAAPAAGQLPAALDGSGGLKVAIVSGGGTGGTASSFGSAFPATGTAIGAKDSTGANLAALNLDASGFLKVNVAAGGGSGGTSSSFAAAMPATGTAAGYSDGTNLQAARVFDLDSGAGTQYVAGVGLRLSASGGSVEGGTATNPIRIDPTGTTIQPINLGQIAGAVPSATNPVPVRLTDGTAFLSSGTEYTDGATAATPSGAAIFWQAAANAMHVVSATNPLPIGDAGGSITVDNAGTFATQSTLQAGTALVGVAISPQQTGALYSGTTALTPKFAAISTAASGNTTVVAAVASKKIRVLSYRFQAGADADVKFRDNTAGVDLTGAMSTGAKGGGGGAAFSPVGHFETAAGNALSVNLSAAVQVSGHLTYIEV
jgi:hypothetical protein